MLRAAAQQLVRAVGAAGCAPSTLEAAAGLRGTGPALTLTSLRHFSASEPPSSSGASDGAVGAGQGGAGSSGRPASKEWRTWVDAKLDSKLEALGQQAAVEEEVAAPAAAADAPAAAATGLPAEKRAKGWELEQQIYSIIAPPRPEQEATLPEGVTSYGQLAMASDAPRFVRASTNLADISPQRLHPTRLFFPRSSYAPADLDPYKTSPTAAAGSLEGADDVVSRATEVGRYADYKNAPLLASFLSDSGKLPLRSRTRLRAKLHRHLSRQVKIARHLAILSPTEKWRPETTPEAAAVAAARAARRQQNGHGPEKGQPRPKQKQQRPAA
ncbi:hypothetical protein COHA_008915 [Chlorella ohadii]|uniref:Small ribosomal subunit protein bS18c n=1 Tax=Chlorella ohadii TaxID=2649997 RepID=A0AAD5DJC9_9CHLO|nr:hypothetical protein COHA_008915 [Chlorella ohadii]